MASVWIVDRVTKQGDRRFDVRWQGPPVALEDGRVRSQLHAGTFRTEREAKARARWCRDEWAAGRVPDPRRIVADHRRRGVTVAETARAWHASRIDLAPSSRLQYASRVDRIVDDLGAIPVGDVTPDDVRAWIAALSAEYAPATVAILVHVLRLVLDHAEVDPNPARHRAVKLPRGSTTNQRVRLPSSSELAAIRGAIGAEHVALLDFLEDSGVRVAEAAALDWRDVHADRVLVRGTKRRASVRFVDGVVAPVRLLAADRGRGLVFPGAGVGGKRFRAAMARACELAGVGRFSPHDLRHLHASRLVQGGAGLADVAARLGHASPATTLRLYAHVVAPD